MYARSTAITSTASRIDDAVVYVRDEVWPGVRGQEGCVGLSMLADRDSGRTVVTSAWRTEQNMRDAEASALPLRERAVDLMGGGPPEVTEWEVASMHRDHHSMPGTCVRAAWSKVEPAKVEGAIDFYKFVLLPSIERLDGFVSASLMVNRQAGRGVTSVAFDTREALERSRDQADYLRGTSTQEASVEFLDVVEFELVFAHLHLPEMV